MGDQPGRRKLAAILAADVAGYSRLMEQDEAATIDAWRAARRTAIDPGIAAHGGRIVKHTGDGFLAEFPAATDAVACAIEMQGKLSALNDGTASDRRMDFRMGINLGEITVDDEDIHGHGVNVAARLESLAEPGGICISGTVHTQVRRRIDRTFEALGELRLKNIDDPVPAYRIVIDGAGPRPPVPARSAKRWLPWAAAAAVLIAAGGVALWTQPWTPTAPGAISGEPALPLPEKPSVAVLPFTNIGGDAAQEPLADGLTDGVINALSQVSGLFVIARNSSFAYKNRSINIQDVAGKLGVGYVLEGGIQRSGTRVRITAQLVDAKNGSPLWAERFDREANELFALQDEITLGIVTALQIELTQGEMARVRQRGTDNLEAWLLVNRSLERFLKFDKEENRHARQLAEQALALDPKYAEAYIRLARTYLTDAQTGWADDREASLNRAIELVQEALKLDPDYPDTYNLLGAIHLFIGQHDRAIAYTERAIALNPNHALAKASLGMIMTYAGMPEKAVPLLRSAMRLSPNYPDWFLGELARAYFQEGRYDDAIAALRQRLTLNPASGEAQSLLAAAYGAAGRIDDARAALRKFLEPRPFYTLKHYAAGEFYKNPADLARVLDGLRKAGLPE